MPSTIMDSFKKAKDVWTNKKIIIEGCPDGWTKNEAFHAAYHALNGPQSRHIYFHQVPESEDFGNVVIFLYRKNSFYQLEASARGVELTVWVHPDIEGELDALLEKFKGKIDSFTQRVVAAADKKDGVIKTIVIEEKIDETINNALNGEAARVVYFSIGKVREFAANIPFLMNASGASLFQLSLNKWMSIAQNIRAANPEAAFPDDKVKPLIADALKWKKYVIDLLNGEWT